MISSPSSVRSCSRSSVKVTFTYRTNKYFILLSSSSLMSTNHLLDITRYRSTKDAFYENYNYQEVSVYFARNEYSVIIICQRFFSNVQYFFSIYYIIFYRNVLVNTCAAQFGFKQYVVSPEFTLNGFTSDIEKLGSLRSMVNLIGVLQLFLIIKLFSSFTKVVT